jgi:Tfp pilus assembly PilM family ATPase
MLSRMRSPIRRVLALDAGTRSIRMLLAQSEFGRFRLLKEDSIDLHEEGLVGPDEVKAWLRERLSEWGEPPLAVVLPQHLSNSQVIDLPPAVEQDVATLIENETLKLSGVSDTRIIYDFVHIGGSNPNRQQYWVTLCREEDIREKFLTLGIEGQDLCEVVPGANALVNAWLRTAPDSRRAVLVHAGAQSTVVAIVQDGQGVFASTFQMGGDFFTRTLARSRNLSEENANKSKGESDILNGPTPSSEMRAAVDGWAAELKRQLNDWFQSGAGGAQASAFPLIAVGGAFEQPGLLEYLKANRALSFKPWPQPETRADLPSKGFEAAYGTALQALGLSSQPVSLLPPDYRLKWKKRLGRERVEVGSLALLIVCTLVLALASWRQLNLVTRKGNFLNKVKAAQEAVEANDSLSGKLASEYETFRPLFARQRNTLDTLNSLALLQQSRSNRSFWYVLVADQQTYFNAPRSLGSTNGIQIVATATTNAAPATLSRLANALPAGTNSAAKPGLIAEVSVPEDPEASRILLSQLVRNLKQQPLYSKVDLLSDDLKRSVADPKVIVPDKDFVLALDFAATDFQPSGHAKRSAGSSSARPGPKRATRQTPPSDNGDTPVTSSP